MPDALTWMHDPAEFEALVHEIFVEAPRLSWTYPPRTLELSRLAESAPTHANRFVVRLFESPAFLLDRYTPAQIDAGLYLLLSWGELAWFPDGVNNQQIPVEDRIRCLRSAEGVYRDLLAPMYGEQVCGLGHAQSGHPDHACFMWWDILHVWPLNYRQRVDLIFGDPTETIRAIEKTWVPDEPAVEDPMINELFDLFGRVLELDSDECRASVLHGIGHHECWHPERARATVAGFLDRNPDVRPELREYAKKAARGNVL